MRTKFAKRTKKAEKTKISPTLPQLSSLVRNTSYLLNFNLLRSAMIGHTFIK